MGLAGFVFPFGLLNLMRANSWFTWFYVAMAAWWGVDLTPQVRAAWKSNPFHRTWGTLRALYFALTIVGAFAAGVYPTIPVAFGGGKPELLLSVTTDSRLAP